jgi:L-fucose isomerase and related proteins
MKLNLVVFRSSLSSGASFEATHAELLAELRGGFEIALCAPGEEKGADGLVLAFIASGGSENDFCAYYRELPKPCPLLTDGLANSLAASLEILSWIRESGGEAEILHGSAAYIKARIEEAESVAAARDRITRAKIGVVGFPSDWLISSAVDYVAAQRRWGASFVNIELAELSRRIASVEESAADAAAKSFAARASKIVEPSDTELIGAARIYLALKSMAAELGLDAFTLKCFDLLPALKTTGCMALALLNEEGLTAGCEGDERTLFSMLVGQAITGRATFMANPAQIDVEKGTAIFAHCTIAPCLVTDFALRSHYESGIGVGIQGRLPEGPVTVFKVGGPGLDRYFVAQGRIVENPADERRCRTQVKVELGDSASYFLRASLANHHVLLPGNYEGKIASFMDERGAMRIR